MNEKKQKIIEFLNMYNEIPELNRSLDFGADYMFEYKHPVFYRIYQSAITQGLEEEEFKYCIKHYKTKIPIILPRSTIHAIGTEIFHGDYTQGFYDTFFRFLYYYLVRFIKPKEHVKIFKSFIMKIKDERILNSYLNEIDKYNNLMTKYANENPPKSKWD